MADYKEMYYKLFNEVTDIIEKLKEIQCKMEEMHAETSGESEEQLFPQKPLGNDPTKIPVKNYQNPRKESCCKANGFLFLTKTENIFKLTYILNGFYV